MAYIIMYFIAAIIVMYLEALDCYKTKTKFNFKYESVFSILWIVSLPLAIYSVWKELK